MKKGAKPRYDMAFVPLFLVSVGALLAVFRLLAGRPAAVRSCDVLLFLGLGLHLVACVVTVLLSRTKHYSAAGYYVVDVCHNGL